MLWDKIKCNTRELHLLGTLSGGQSFRWVHDKILDEWTGVFAKTAWKLRQKEDCLEYSVLGTLQDVSENEHEYYRSLLTNYFRLDTNLEKYYKEWSEKDELFKTASVHFYGIRMLNQEPVENLFSFICSQNNHISRISKMVENLCTQYGEAICKCDNVTYYTFPEVEELAPTQVEKELRNLGFGYRANFIQKSAAQILEWGGEKWFKSLKDMEYKDARQELMKLHGIGPKVADCISLMSLNHLESVPVDTHVYQIAAQNYLPHLRGKKNVTDKMYAEIGEHFRDLYGNMAGWAHTVLFCADLKKFQQNKNSDTGETKRKRKKIK